MRIHYLSSSPIPSRLANSVHAMKMADALAQLGHDTTLFASRGDIPADPWSWYAVPPGFKLEVCARPRLRGVGAAVYGFAVASRSKALGLPDFYYGRSLPAVAAAAGTGRPFAFELHAPPRGRVGRLLSSWLFRRANFKGLVTISQVLKDDVLAMFPGLSPDQVMVAYDGATPVAAAAPAPRREGPFRVGYGGHLYPGKGMEVIAAVAPMLPEIEFHVAGGDAQRLADWARRCPPNVRLHGHVDQAALAGLYATFDVAVAPLQPGMRTGDGATEIWRWTSPLKVFEYMSHGLPIVASDLPVLSEVLTNEVTALIVPSADITAWANALCRLRDNPDLCGRLGRAGRDAFLAHYTWQMRAQTILARFMPVQRQISEPGL